MMVLMRGKRMTAGATRMMTMPDSNRAAGCIRRFLVGGGGLWKKHGNTKELGATALRSRSLPPLAYFQQGNLDSSTTRTTTTTMRSWSSWSSSSSSFSSPCVLNGKISTADTDNASAAVVAAAAADKIRRYSSPSRRYASGVSSGDGNAVPEDSVDPATTAAGSAGTTAGSVRSRYLRGVVLDHAVDLRNVRAGDRLEIPYEITLSEAMQDFWFAAFFDQNRIHTSRPFCRSMGLQDRVVPFSLALFLTSGMSHADAAKVQVGFGTVSYLWPLFPGDTVTKSFAVNRIRNTSDGNHSVVHFTCDLRNQRGRLCMRADKRLLYQFPVPESNISPRERRRGGRYDGDGGGGGGDAVPINTHLFRDHLLSKATTVLTDQPSQSLSRLEPGTLILHTMHRSLTFSQCQQLASLGRLTHERHFDIKQFDVASEILIPGGLVLGIAMSSAARDLHEILHEEIKSCCYVNALHPDNVVGSVSYISSVDDNLPGDLEVVSVTTLGIKNINVRRDLYNADIPVELFRGDIYSKEIEQICKTKCPILSNKIVIQVHRKILRQTNHRTVFLL